MKVKLNELRMLIRKALLTEGRFTDEYHRLRQTIPPYPDTDHDPYFGMDGYPNDYMPQYLDDLHARMRMDPNLASVDYLRWGWKQIQASRELERNTIVSEIIDVLRSFVLSKQRLPPASRDISSHRTLGDLRGALEALGPSRKSKMAAGSEVAGGYEVLLDDGIFGSYHVKTTEASQRLGRGTKWCIAATESKNYFDQYTKDGVKFAFLISKGNEGKWAYAFSLQTGTESYRLSSFNDYTDVGLDLEIYNAADEVEDEYHIWNKEQRERAEEDGREHGGEFGDTWEALKHAIQRHVRSCGANPAHADAIFGLMRSHAQKIVDEDSLVRQAVHGGAAHLVERMSDFECAKAFWGLLSYDILHDPRRINWDKMKKNRVMAALLNRAATEDPVACTLFDVLAGHVIPLSYNRYTNLTTSGDAVRFTQAISGTLPMEALKAHIAPMQQALGPILESLVEFRGVGNVIYSEPWIIKTWAVTPKLGRMFLDEIKRLMEHSKANGYPSWEWVSDLAIQLSKSLGAGEEIRQETLEMLERAQWA